MGEGSWPSTRLRLVLQSLAPYALRVTVSSELVLPLRTFCPARLSFPWWAVFSILPCSVERRCVTGGVEERPAADQWICPRISPPGKSPGPVLVPSTPSFV